MNLRLAKFLNVALLSCVAALGLGRPAEAAYVVVNADPAFGSPFANLGWRATGAVYVPNGCLGSAGLASVLTGTPLTVTLSGGTSPSLPFGGPAINSLCRNSLLEDVRVYFYNLDDPDKKAVEMLDIDTYTRDTGPKDQETDESQRLIDLVFDGFALVGFHTSLSFRLPATDILAGAGDYAFSLEFSSDDAHLVAYGPNGKIVSPNGANVVLQPYVANSNYSRVPNEEVVATVITVPEPAALALTLTALATALGAGGRRRRSRRV